MDCIQRRRTGFFAAAGLHDVAEDEFALAAGVAGIDDGVDIRAFEELFEGGETVGAAFDGFEFEVVRDEGEAIEVPLGFFAVGGFWEGEFEEVAYCGGDDVGIIFEVVFLLVEFGHARGFGEDAGEVGGDTGFFGDDESFPHGTESLSGVVPGVGRGRWRCFLEKANSVFSGDGG